MKNKRINSKAVLLFCTAAVMTACALVSCSRPEVHMEVETNVPEQEQAAVSNVEQNDIPDWENAGGAAIQVLSAVEEDEWVVVDTSYGRLFYSSAFADLIEVKAVNQGTIAQLQFLMRMGEKEYTAYSLHYNDFNNENRIPCGTLTVSEETGAMEVSVVFEEEPQGLSEDWLKTFYAVQETFNDVIVSMMEDSRFTPAE